MGLITSSGTWAIGGSFAIAMVILAISIGFRILDRCSADGGVGLSSNIGVSTSPGNIVVTRIPFSRSSSVALVPNAAIANLLAL